MDFLFTALNIALYVIGAVAFFSILDTVIDTHRKKRNIKLVRKMVAAGVDYHEACLFVEALFPINRTPRRQ